MGARSCEVLSGLREETIDRFGPMPAVLAFLFDVAEIGIRGPDYGILQVLCGQDETVVQCEPDGPLRETRAPAGWFRRMNGFIGPDGFRALGEFLAFLSPKI